MAKSITLHELLQIKPEHTVPHPGNLAALTYPSVNGSVSVEVITDPLGYAQFLVHAPAPEVNRSLETAERALIRMTGNDPQNPKSKTIARTSMGAQAFDNNLNLLVRQRLFSLAVVRTGILPFLLPEYLAGDEPKEGADFEFKVRFLMRPYSDLSSYDPVELAFPPKKEIDEAQVNERLSQMMGGQIRWQDVPEDAASGFDKMKATIRTQIEAESYNSWYSELMTMCADKLTERLVSQPSVKYIELLRDEMASQYATAVQDGGQNWNDYIKTPGFDLNTFKEQMTSEALVALRRGLALDALAEHEHIELTEEDILECLSNIARGHELEAAQAMIDNGQLPQLLETARRAKTGDFLASRAKDVR